MVYRMHKDAGASHLGRCFRSFIRFPITDTHGLASWPAPWAGIGRCCRSWVSHHGPLTQKIKIPIWGLVVDVSLGFQVAF
jgi:hypothetical protein